MPETNKEISRNISSVETQLVDLTRIWAAYRLSPVPKSQPHHMGYNNPYDMHMHWHTLKYAL